MRSAVSFFFRTRRSLAPALGRVARRRFGSTRAASDQAPHLLARVLEVPSLVARALAGHEQAPVRIEPRRDRSGETRARGGRQAADGAQVDAQLDLRRHLVDVLPARARRADRAPGDGRGRHRDAAARPRWARSWPDYNRAVLRTSLLVGAGGFAGCCLRYWAGLAGARLAGGPTPWATAFVNLTGCLAIGFLSARSLSPELRAFALVGVLGGYTTFSTFGYETFALLEQGRARPRPRERGRSAGPGGAGGVRGRPARAGTA